GATELPHHGIRQPRTLQRSNSSSRIPCLEFLRFRGAAMLGCTRMRASPPAVVPAAALSKEWLLGNGVGAYASGIASGAHVREFHAALSTVGPTGRLAVRLRRLTTRVAFGERTFDLDPMSASRGHPHAQAILEEFARTPWPVWRYRAGESVLEKRLLLLRDAPAI